MHCDNRNPIPKKVTEELGFGRHNDKEWVARMMTQLAVIRDAMQFGVSLSGPSIPGPKGRRILRLSGSVFEFSAGLQRCQDPVVGCNHRHNAVTG